MGFQDLYQRKRAWSIETFGPDGGVDRVLAHMRRELGELREAIRDQERSAIRAELADLCLLALDLSWRSGGSAADFVGAFAVRHHVSFGYCAENIERCLGECMPPRQAAVAIWTLAYCALYCELYPIEEKLAENMQRRWPDWRTVEPGQPIEHLRESTGHVSLAQELAAISAKIASGQGYAGASSEALASMGLARQRLERLIHNRRENHRGNPALSAVIAFAIASGVDVAGSARACPKCGATDGHRCTSATGRRRRPHARRLA
jgi:hypothetical protein